MDNNQLPEKLRSPDACIAFIRSSYKTPFYPSAICLITAIGFALWRTANHWVTAVSFAASALIYLPIGFSLYRKDKQNCEKAIRNYKIWYQKHHRDSKSES